MPHGDQDLLILDPFRGLRVLAPAAFWKWESQHDETRVIPGVARIRSRRRRSGVGGWLCPAVPHDVDPNRLRRFNVPLGALIAAVRDSNLNVGGNVLDSKGAWVDRPRVGQVQSITTSADT